MLNKDALENNYFYLFFVFSELTFSSWHRKWIKYRLNKYSGSVMVWYIPIWQQWANGFLWHNLFLACVDFWTSSSGKSLNALSQLVVNKLLMLLTSTHSARILSFLCFPKFWLEDWKTFCLLIWYFHLFFCCFFPSSINVIFIFRRRMLWY